MAGAKGAKAGSKAPPGFAIKTVPENLASRLKKGQGRAVFSSSRGSQLSYFPLQGLSVFTYHLQEALQGSNNKPGEMEVKVSNLMNHLGTTVPASVQRLFGMEQTPFFNAATEDFAIALVWGGKGLPGGGWASVQAEAEETIIRAEREISQMVQASDRGVAIGGSVSDSIIITGDQNIVQRGKYNVKTLRLIYNQSTGCLVACSPSCLLA